MSVHFNPARVSNPVHPASDSAYYQDRAAVSGSDHDDWAKFGHIENGDMLLARAPETASKRTFGISQPGIPDLAPPTFTTQHIENFDTKPKGLAISDDEFKMIATDYAAEVQYAVVTKIAPLYGRGKPQLVSDNSMAVLDNTVLSRLFNRNPLIYENYLATVVYGVYGVALDQKAAYYNRFLLAGSKYLDLVRSVDGVEAIVIRDVKEWKKVGVTVKGKELDVPVVYLTDQATPWEDDERKTLSHAEFLPVLGIIKLADDAVRYSVEKLKRRARQYPQGGKIVEKDEGSPCNFLDAFVEGSHRHEGTHGFLAQQFPRASANMSNPERREPCSAEVTFSGDVKMKLDKECPPMQFHELAAVGVNLATVPCKGALRLFNYFEGCLQMGTSDGKPPIPYDLVFHYIISALGTIPDLAPDLRKKIEVQSGTGVTTGLIVEIMADPAVTTARVNEIGRKMWSLGYELLRRAEAAHK